MIERTLAAVTAATLLFALPACGGAGAPLSPVAPSATAHVPLVASVVVIAVFKGKPINKQLVILGRSRRGGPVIAKGRTGPMGRVALHGSWTRTEFICAWGTYIHDGGSSQATYCQTPFPNQVKLEFSN